MASALCHPATTTYGATHWVATIGPWVRHSGLLQTRMDSRSGIHRYPPTDLAWLTRPDLYRVPEVRRSATSTSTLWTSAPVSPRASPITRTRVRRPRDATTPCGLGT